MVVLKLELSHIGVVSNAHKFTWEDLAVVHASLFPSCLVYSSSFLLLHIPLIPSWQESLFGVDAEDRGVLACCCLPILELAATTLSASSQHAPPTGAQKHTEQQQQQQQPKKSVQAKKLRGQKAKGKGFAPSPLVTAAPPPALAATFQGMDLLQLNAQRLDLLQVRHLVLSGVLLTSLFD